MTSSWRSDVPGTSRSVVRRGSPGSSLPRGPWRGSTASPVCPSMGWLERWACVSRRCTCTSIRNMRSTARCSPAATGGSLEGWTNLTADRPSIGAEGDPPRLPRLRARGSARCELLFERHVPASSPRAMPMPSPKRRWGGSLTVMHQAGVTDQGHIDCLVAMTAGLMEAQMVNDPGGDRWVRHLDRMVDLQLDDIQRRRDA